MNIGREVYVLYNWSLNLCFYSVRNMLAKLKKKIRRKYIRSLYGNKVVIKNYKNLLLLLRATNHLDRLLLSNIPFEVEQLQYFVELVNKFNANMFVDVGANFGLYSLSLAKAELGLDRIIAIEAQKENYNQLCGNIFLNKLDNMIETKGIGVSSSTGEVKFLKNKGGSTGTSRIQSTAPATTKFHNFEDSSIKVDTLDNLLGSIEGKIICFKIDVEGHEYHVLKGMRNILKNNRCLFQIEVLQNKEETIKTVNEVFGLKKIHMIGHDIYFDNE